MIKREREILGTTIFILLILLGETFGGDAFKWVWIIGMGALFLFFAVIPGGGKPNKFKERD